LALESAGMISVPDDKPGGRPELKVLALNSGSSSLKFGLYRAGPSRADMLISGEAEGIGEAKGKLHAKDSQNNSLLSEAMAIPGQRDALVRVAKLVADSKMPAPDAIGHRIVHGGPKLRQHCLIDGPVLQQLEMFCYSVPKQIAAMIAALGGLDLLAFTGGIGDSLIISSNLRSVDRVRFSCRMTDCPLQAFGSGVFDDHLHQAPTQPMALEVRPEQYCILAAVADRAGVHADDPERLAACLVEGDKGHCSCVVDLG